MFVQVIQGQVSDATQVRAQLDRWVAKMAPGAVGWLGSTSGVTDDGRLVALVRFESEEVAQQNGDRPEQTAWWEQTATLFTDEPVSTTARRSRSAHLVTPRRPASCRSCRVDRATRTARVSSWRMIHPTGRSCGPRSSASLRGSRRRRLDDGDLLHLRGGGSRR